MKIRNLTPNPKNPRKCTEEKKRMLADSMNEFGDLSGVIFNTKSKQLVGGHQRSSIFEDDVKIVITKKYAKPNRVGTVAEGYIVTKDGVRFSYRKVRWPRSKELAANKAANKNAGEWDLPQLKLDFKELSSFGFDLDMGLTMFDEKEVKKVLGVTVKEHTRTGGQDKTETKTVRPRTQSGDIFLLGTHQLHCNDSTADTVLEAWEDATGKIATLMSRIKPTIRRRAEQQRMSSEVSQ